MMLELAAAVVRLEHLGQVTGPNRRKQEPVFRRYQPGGVGDRSHLDRTLRAVEERVEHLWVDVVPLQRFGLVANYRLGVKVVRAWIALNLGASESVIAERLN